MSSGTERTQAISPDPQWNGYDSTRWAKKYNNWVQNTHHFLLEAKDLKGWRIIGYGINFFAPKKILHLGGTIVNFLSFVEESLIGTALILPGTLAKAIAFCIQDRKDKTNFYNNWNWSAFGHYSNALSYLIAAITDIASVLITPSLVFDLNNKIKQGLSINDRPLPLSQPRIEEEAEPKIEEWEKSKGEPKPEPKIENKEISTNGIVSGISNLFSSTCKADMCISNQFPGLIGEIQDDFPSYFGAKFGFTCEDGSPLPLNPEDFFICIHIFNTPKIPNVEFFLPAALFQGKKNGDKVRLRFKNQLFEFTINQNAPGGYPIGPFEQLFERIKDICYLDRGHARPLFDNKGKSKFTGEIVLQNQQKKEMQKKGNSLMESWKQFNSTPHKMWTVHSGIHSTNKGPKLLNLGQSRYGTHKKNKNIMVEVCVGKLEDLHIALNDQYLVISSYKSEKDKEKERGEEYVLDTTSDSDICFIPWKDKGLANSLIEMEEKIEKASFYLKDGIFQLHWKDSSS